MNLRDATVLGLVGTGGGALREWPPGGGHGRLACLSSYRASGTGDYECCVGCPILREIGTEMTDMLLDYFRAHDGNLPRIRSDCRVF